MICHVLEWNRRMAECHLALVRLVPCRPRLGQRGGRAVPAIVLRPTGRHHGTPGTAQPRSNNHREDVRSS